MKKFYFLSTLLSLGMWLNASAQSGKVDVLYVDGSSHEVSISQVARLQVKGDDVVLLGQDSTAVATHKLADIEKIRLTATTDGISKLATSSRLVFRSNGNTVSVENIADGQTLEIYSANGQLVGKATAQGGKATVSVASLANGVYAVKAQGQQLKMVKR